jgi:hypothetical protein
MTNEEGCRFMEGSKIQNAELEETGEGLWKGIRCAPRR